MTTSINQSRAWRARSRNKGQAAIGWPRAVLRSDHATCFSARLRTEPLRKSRAETDNSKTEQRHDDDKLCHGAPVLSHSTL